MTIIIIIVIFQFIQTNMLQNRDSFIHSFNHFKNIIYLLSFLQLISFIIFVKGLKVVDLNFVHK